MLTRTTARSVTFKHPFRLDGVDDIQPAGSYVVESEEELLQALSFPGWRRRSMVIRLRASGANSPDDQVTTVDAAALEAALLKDADG